MRCSSGRSCRRPSGPGAPLAVALALALAAAGCVSRATHERKLDQLRAEVGRLDGERRDQKRSLDAMERERNRLLQEIEDLRDARTSLHADLAARDEKLRDMRGSYDALVQDLEADVASGQLRIEELTEGLSFRLPQDVLFPPGSAVLEPAGRKAVAEIAARIEGREGRVEVQGHTDDRPIGGALAQRYPTNWELAGARAASVVRVLEESGVAADRLAAVSFGPTRPLAANDTPAGRAQNRRIEVRVLPTATSALPARETAADAPPAVDAGSPGVPDGVAFDVAPDVSAQPEPAAEPDESAEPEAAAEPEASAEPEPAAEPEAAPAPAPRPKRRPARETRSPLTY